MLNVIYPLGSQDYSWGIINAWIEVLSLPLTGHQIFIFICQLGEIVEKMFYIILDDILEGGLGI